MSRIESLSYREPDAELGAGLGWRPKTGDLVDHLLQKWQASGRRGALVGPHGSGKTTLLEEVEARLWGQAHRVHQLRLNTEKRSIPKAERQRLMETLDTDPEPQNLVVSIDGVEQLGMLAWISLRRNLELLLRRGGGLWVTSHHADRLLGSLHTPTLRRHCTSPALLSELVGELAGAKATSADIDDLWRRHRGNLRACLRELYDRSATSSCERGI